MPSEALVAIAEESARVEISGLWDTHQGVDGRFAARPEAKDRMRASSSRIDALPANAPAPRGPHPRTSGATYAHDGTVEGLLSAVHDAFMAHDAAADILAAANLQPRLGQTVVTVETSMEIALKVRRLVEHDLGRRAFQCILSAAAADDPAKGTAIYRFIRLGMAKAGTGSCTRCPKKATCTRACRAASGVKWMEDLAQPEVHAVVALYRSVVNERHLMLQFMRFEHCEGDVWFARCNPKSSVVPLLMDWFIARFNDQKFVIYDLGRATTSIQIVGGYSGETMEQVKIICTPRESFIIKRFLATHDPKAFVSVTSVASVWGLGKGFSDIRKIDG